MQACVFGSTTDVIVKFQTPRHRTLPLTVPSQINNAREPDLSHDIPIDLGTKGQ